MPQDMTEKVVNNAALQLKEVFDSFIIIGLPLDTEEEPSIIFHGEKKVALSLAVLAADKMKGEE